MISVWFIFLFALLILILKALSMKNQKVNHDWSIYSESVYVIIDEKKHDFRFAKSIIVWSRFNPIVK